MLEPVTLIIGSVTILVVWSYIKSRRPSNAPPGPFVWPFVGNLRALASTSTYHLTANEYYKKFGPITSVQMAWYPCVILSDIRVIKEALIEHADQFSDRPLWLPFMQVITRGRDGIIFVNGEPWNHTKKTVVSSLRQLGFDPKTLEGKIHDELEVVIQELDQVKGKEHNFGLLFSMATSNIVCAILFGKRYEYGDSLHEHLLIRSKLLFKRTRFQNPYLFLPSMFEYLMLLLSPSMAKAVNVNDELAKFIKDKIAEHKSSFDADNIRDLIDLLLEAGADESNIIQMGSDMFSAGSVTPSSSLLWAFLFMIQNPDVQEKCRQEIHEVVGLERMPSLNDREQLPYTNATIMEVLRLGSIVPMSIMHNTNSALKFEGYDIPKDTVVFINNYSVHMDPKNWDQPEVFRPERFLSADKRSTVKPEAFIPFGIGRRTCQGENIAKMELFLLFSGLIQRFRFSTNDPDKLPTLRDCTLGVVLIPDQYSVIIQDIN